MAEGGEAPPVLGFKVGAFNWRLRKAREARGLTLAQLGAATGFSGSYLGNVERLQTPLTPAVADALALALETPVDVLFPALLDGLLVDHGGVEVALREADVARFRGAGPPPALAMSDALLGERLEEALAQLGEREREVLTRRFGLDGLGPRTLSALAQEFGVTLERIRQIEALALVRMRHPSRSRALRPFAAARLSR